MISGIQHFIFCKRQWALIHVEQQWQENFFTIDGQLKHEKVDNVDLYEKRKNTVKIHALSIKSAALGITGKCDIVEMKKSKKGIYFPKYEDTFLIYPVEFKRGKPKEDIMDALQLTAQAYCLEEMLETHIDKGYLFYFETRRRVEVIFSDELREKLVQITKDMHSYIKNGYTPRWKKQPKCRSCSLNNVCVPSADTKKSVGQYIQRRISE